MIVDTFLHCVRESVHDHGARRGGGMKRGPAWSAGGMERGRHGARASHMGGSAGRWLQDAAHDPVAHQVGRGELELPG
jgi:hypothetical protein